jgi:hypothetical protein
MINKFKHPLSVNVVLLSSLCFLFCILTKYTIIIPAKAHTIAIIYIPITSDE